MKKILLSAALVLSVTACVNTPVEELNPDDSQPTVESNDHAADSLLTYTSDDYAFSLQFPKTWEGYTVEEDTAYDVPSLSFKTKEGVDMFTVTIFTMEAWAKEQAFDQPHPDELGRSDTMVYGWSTAQDFTGAEAFVKDLSVIKASFKAL